MFPGYTFVAVRVIPTKLGAIVQHRTPARHRSAAHHTASQVSVLQTTKT